MITSFAPRRRSVLSIGSLLAVTLLLLLLDSTGAFAPFKDGTSGVLGAWQGRAQSFADRVGVARGGVQDTQELQRRLALVTAQRDQLLVENSRLADLEAQNELLRKQLDFQAAQPKLEFLTAEVYKNDRESVRKEIIIGKGAADRLAVGMAVTTPEGFMVGIVTKVEANTALVTLIVDQTMRISAVVQQNGTQATVHGAWQQSKRLLLRNVDKNAKVQKGQRVITGTFTNGVSPNLLIGEVLDVRADPVADSQEIEVVPYAEFDKLRLVNVIVGRKSQ